MEMKPYGPGIWRWTQPHPDWKPSPAGSPGDWGKEVACVRYEPSDAEAPLVLIDPLVPESGTPEEKPFWQELDAALERSGRSVAVVVANMFHHRSAAAVHERYRDRPGCAVWIPEGSQERMRKVGCPATEVFDDGQELPGGMRAFAIEGLCPGETVLYLPQQEMILVADALLGVDGKRLRLPPSSWAADQAQYHASIRPSLRRLLDVSIEQVLVSHGPPVLSGGRQAVAGAIEPAGA